MNNSLVIMAGGASSRMKRSLEGANLDADVIYAAQNWHKSLIPIDDHKRPLLFYLLRNAVNARIQKVYIITSAENQPFYKFLDSHGSEELLTKLQIEIAIQKVPEDRDKPLGTADAVQQCMDQYPELKQQYFTVCNGDNLYSSNVMGKLRMERTAPHAIMAYSGSGLGFDDERLSKFAVMDIDPNGNLLQIIEKPDVTELNQFRDEHGELAISMNIFNFSGEHIYSFLMNCPLHSIRNEKELPDAVRMAVRENPSAFSCIPVSELLPDLTTSDDIKKMNLYL
ncbi:sugar phosphate nucleotidyltransferase [Croceivirga thetidis]|uniref:NTP transferase domain-containing protein n=1 Tax=Croceivirga thetidis TaxID=2721623 RepID=A0ABX1GWI1_9FLAO|nr:sugar phosphate nucleotidyltransferase [Croceivirga thetidis]NKI33366.1 NTP transferase domain-containing protein [Croceivirga thetidis]